MPVSSLFEVRFKAFFHFVPSSSSQLHKGGKCWIGSWGRHCPSKKFKHVLPWQRINFFPLACELGRKDRLYYNMTRMQEVHGFKVILDSSPHSCMTLTLISY
jgi:hypothetical protein